MIPLAEFILARLDEDERESIPPVVVHSGGAPASVVPNCIGVDGTGCELGGWSIDPAQVSAGQWPALEREHALTHATEAQKRMLRRIAADRRIIAECVRTLEFEDYGYTLADGVLRLLALPHERHPDYDQAWAPRAEG